MEPLRKPFQARRLRKEQTTAEAFLWQMLRNRRLNGEKFHRQFPIGPFIADFCCRKRRLVIELDGKHHSESTDYDGKRTDYLKEYGYKVIRFRNEEVFSNPLTVWQQLIQALKECPVQDPLPLGRPSVRCVAGPMVSPRARAKVARGSPDGSPWRPGEAG